MLVQKLKKAFDNVLLSYSLLLFMQNKAVGFLLLLITFLNHNIALHGIVAWLASRLFAKFFFREKMDVYQTVYAYNSLLVGFSIGFMFKISVLSIFMTITASIMTLLLSLAIANVLFVYFKLPALNIPFTIISTIIYLASVRYSSLLVDSFYPYENLNLAFLPAFLQAFFRTLGVLIFMPYDVIGIVILIALFLHSKITFLLTVFSYSAGILFLALYKGSFALAQSDISTFNFILIGIALGGIFLIPSKRTYLYALLGVMISVFVLDAVSVFWSVLGIPVFTLPFNLIVLLFLYALQLSHYDKINFSIQESPEKSLIHYLAVTRRFDTLTPQPTLPFSGKWTVYQSFDDKWTHKGHGKYAYDFVITDEEGKNFSHDEMNVKDYYCFGKPVLSPISGTVIEAYDQLPDNAIGEVNEKKNWGNYLILYSPFGYYVEISHFQYQSLQVKAGDSVTLGQVVGKCGNSGYSPQPHIHFQVQYFPQLGAETTHFYFSNAKNQKNEALGNEILNTGETVEPIFYSKKMYRQFQFLLDDEYVYDVFCDEKFIRQITIICQMAEDGTMFFQIKGLSSRLYYGINENSFTIYSLSGNDSPFFKMLFMALSKVPLTDNDKLTWQEPLPDSLVSSSRMNALIKSINPRFRKLQGAYHFSKKQIIGYIPTGKSVISTTAILHSEKGIEELIVNDENKKWHWKLVKK
jgi:urea transporter